MLIPQPHIVIHPLQAEVMGGTVNAAWWWSALREGAVVDHLCCLCGASSVHRLKGGVRRQMLNDSLKATALALISSPVCAGCHSNWPEHLSNAAYIGLLDTTRIYRAHIPIKGRRHVCLMWLWCRPPVYKKKVSYLFNNCAIMHCSIEKKIEIIFSMCTYIFHLIRPRSSEYKKILYLIFYVYLYTGRDQKSKITWVTTDRSYSTASYTSCQWCI